MPLGQKMSQESDASQKNKLTSPEEGQGVFIKRLKKQIVWLKNEQVVSILKFCFEAQPRSKNEQKLNCKNTASSLS